MNTYFISIFPMEIPGEEVECGNFCIIDLEYAKKWDRNNIRIEK